MDPEKIELDFRNLDIPEGASVIKLTVDPEFRKLFEKSLAQVSVAKIKLTAVENLFKEACTLLLECLEKLRTFQGCSASLSDNSVRHNENDVPA